MGKSTPAAKAALAPRRRLNRIYQYLHVHLVQMVRRGVPLERRRLHRTIVAHPGMDTAALERRRTRRMIWVSTALAVISAAPAVAVVSGPIGWGLAITGVILATGVETFLSLREQIRYVVHLLLLRGYVGSEAEFVELTLSHAFGRSDLERVSMTAKTSAGALASQGVQELGETAAEIIAMKLTRRVPLRFGARVPLRIFPFVGLLVGAGISYVQARLTTRRILDTILVPAEPQPGQQLRKVGLEQLVARAMRYEDLDGYEAPMRPVEWHAPASATAQLPPQPEALVVTVSER